MPKYDDQGNLIEEEEVEQLDDSQEEAQEELQDEQEQDEEQHEDEVDQEDEADDSQEEEAETEERQPSRREQLRINDLLRKYGRPEEQSQNRASAPQGINYRDMIDADDEVYNQLDNVSRQYGQEQYQMGLKEATKMRFETRLEVDAPRVEAKYPQLDKNSSEFNPAVASSINQMYLSAVGYDEQTGYVANDSIRYAEYVEAMFELVDEAANRKVESTRRNVTRQAGRTGLRPDGSSARTNLDLNKDPSQMSDKELDAAMTKLGLTPKQ